MICLFTIFTKKTVQFPHHTLWKAFRVKCRGGFRGAGEGGKGAPPSPFPFFIFLPFLTVYNIFLCADHPSFPSPNLKMYLISCKWFPFAHGLYE